jgi:hypothetical protein
MVPQPRVNDLLDQLRQEYEAQQTRTAEYEHKRTSHAISSCTGYCYTNRVVGAGVGDMLLTCHSAATAPGDGGCEADRV